MNRGGRGGEKSLLCDPGSKLRLGGSENRRAKIINGMEKEKDKKKGCDDSDMCDDSDPCAENELNDLI